MLQSLLEENNLVIKKFDNILPLAIYILIKTNHTKLLFFHDFIPTKLFHVTKFYLGWLVGVSIINHNLPCGIKT